MEKFFEIISTYAPFLSMIAIFIIVSLVLAITNKFDDLTEWLFKDWHWVYVLICCVFLAGIICGFIFLTWWIMLIILLSMIIITAVITIIIWRMNKPIPYEKWTDDELKEMCIEYKIKDYKKLNREQMIEKLTEFDYGIERKSCSYKCKNCGSLLTEVKIEHNNGYKTHYECPHCDSEYTKKELKSSVDQDHEEEEEIELTDFEEDYFAACNWFDFRPYNTHSENQIENRYDKLQINEDYEDYEEETDNAYEFLINNLNEINEYIKNTEQKNIKERYNIFLTTDEDDE